MGIRLNRLDKRGTLGLSALTYENRTTFHDFELDPKSS